MTPGWSVLRMTIIVPSSGASTPMPSSSTSRGDRSLEHGAFDPALAVAACAASPRSGSCSCAARVLRDSTISMPRSAATVRAFTSVTPRRQHRLEQADQHGVDDHVGAALRPARRSSGRRPSSTRPSFICARNAPSRSPSSTNGCSRLNSSAEHRREVDGVADDAVAQEVAQRRRRFHADQLLALARRRGDVRRGDDLRQHLQPVIDGRLLLEHVERGAADVARLRSRRPAPPRRSGRRARC